MLSSANFDHSVSKLWLRHWFLAFHYPRGEEIHNLQANTDIQMLDFTV